MHTSVGPVHERRDGVRARAHTHTDTHACTGYRATVCHVCTRVCMPPQRHRWCLLKHHPLRYAVGTGLESDPCAGMWVDRASRRKWPQHCGPSARTTASNNSRRCSRPRQQHMRMLPPLPPVLLWVYSGGLCRPPRILTITLTLNLPCRDQRTRLRQHGLGGKAVKGGWHLMAVECRRTTTGA